MTDKEKLEEDEVSETVSETTDEDSADVEGHAHFLGAESHYTGGQTHVKGGE